MRTLLSAAVLAGALAASAQIGTSTASPQASAGSILFTGGPGGTELPSSPRMYAVDARGGRPKELLVDVREAHWSPDGTKLAFTRQRPVSEPWINDLDLFVERADGRGLRRIARLAPEISSDPNFAWSPDGRKIALRTRVRGVDVVLVLDLRTGRKANLGEGAKPVWSPDGGRVAMVAHDPTLPNSPGGDSTLFVVNANGSGRRQVTFGQSVFGLSPQSWAPDGKQVAFYPCCLHGFSIVDVDTGRARSYLDGMVALPSWAPNGAWIAVSVSQGTWLIRPNGTGRRRLSDLGGSPFDPAWSPDSRTLAVEDRCCSPDVWALSVSEGRARRLTSGWRYGYGNYHPEWQPASLSTAKLAGRYVAWSWPTDSVAAKGVLRTSQPIRTLSADGAHVAMDFERGWSEVWQPQTGSVARFASGGRVGLGGDRLAWVYGPSSQMGGDDWAVSTATLALPRLARVPGGSLWGRTRPLSDPLGDGPLIVFSSWGPCRISFDPPCLHEPKTNGELYALDGERAVRIASGPGALTPVSVDTGRILVDRENGTYELRDASGTLLRTFVLDAPIVRGVRLQGRDLVVLTTTSVEVTDAETGSFLRRWPLPAASAQLVDVDGGIAVLVAGSDIHLLQLADGRNTVVKAPGTHVLAQLEPSGLFYAYRADDPKYPGRVAFVPSVDLPLR